MRSGFVGFRPLYLESPSCPCPLNTYSFLFLFMSFCLHVPSSHSVPSFARTTARPLACTRATYLQPRFQVAQVLTMRSGSLVVPAHLVSPSSQPDTLVLSCLLLMSSSFCLLCAHMHTCSSLSFCSPARGVRVCETLGITQNQLTIFAGGNLVSIAGCPTKRCRD